MAALSKKLQDALNDQVNAELHSAYTYLSMVAYFEAENWPGFAHWMRVQSREEIEHAIKIFDFINDRGGRVTLQAIDKPPVRFRSPLDAFQKAYQQEQKVTGLIHKLYELAVKENDYPTQVMLHWFIDEQVEEEKITGEVVAKLEMVSEHKPALLMLDRELGAREEE
jgi:ferritin